MEGAMDQIVEENKRGFPTAAGILLGLGIGGFFDGILLHQVLQWHHMLSSGGFPPDSLENMRVNVLWDGLFHILTYIFVALGLLLLWRAASQPHTRWSGKMLAGTLLIGFGLFNMVEGLIDHQLLGIHHVNETVPPEQWIYWDIGFLIWGAAMLVGGWYLLKAGQRETVQVAMVESQSRIQSPSRAQSRQLVPPAPPATRGRRRKRP
jgi:uncharacterized membrane protein